MHEDTGKSKSKFERLCQPSAIAAFHIIIMIFIYVPGKRPRNDNEIIDNNNISKSLLLFSDFTGT